jgi:hypothetical protein
LHYLALLAFSPRDTFSLYSRFLILKNGKINKTKMPSLAEQEATLNQFIQGWKKWSTEEMLASWAESATQKALPFSLGHPARTRAQVEETLPFLQRVVTNYEVSRIIT